MYLIPRGRWCSLFVFDVRLDGFVLYAKKRNVALDCLPSADIVTKKGRREEEDSREYIGRARGYVVHDWKCSHGSIHSPIGGSTRIHPTSGPS